MRPVYPLIFAISLLLYRCDTSIGPDTGIEPKGDLEDREYVLVDGFPYGTINFGPATTSPGHRLQFKGDSVRVFNPFTFDGEQRIRAYEADSTARYPDSLYLTYQIGEDSTLTAMVRSASGWGDVAQEFQSAETMIFRDLPNGMDGATYQITLNGTDFVMYVEEMTGSKGKDTFSMKTVKLMSLSDGPKRGIEFVRTGFGMGDRQGIIIPVTTDGRGFPRRGTHDRLRLSYSTDGRLLGYLLHFDENRVEGPIFAQTLPSVIPDSVPTSNLLNILNTGKVTVSLPPPEPDSVGIEYSTRTDGEDDRLVTHNELDRLDFEFGQDDQFRVYLGNRIVQGGKWKFSEGRQLIDIKSTASSMENAHLIEDYAPGMLTFSLPIQIKTHRPRGVQLTSYYTPLVQVKFELE